MSSTTTRPKHRDPGATGSWFVSISLVLVIVAGSLLARPLFTTADWTSDAIIMAAAVIGASALVRTFTGGVLWPSVAATVVFIAVLSFRLQPDSIAGFFTAWGNESVRLVDQLMSDAPPYRETPEAVTALVAIVGLVAMVCDLCVFGLRGRVSAVLPVLVFPMLPVIAGVLDVDLWPALWLAGAFALYLFAAGWWHQRIADDRLADAGYLVDDRGLSGWFGALATAAAGIVLAIVASFIVPAPQGVPWLMPNPGATLSTNRANPILDLGDDLRRDEPINVLQYATSIAQGQLPYLSLVTLSQLDGEREWGPGEFSADATTDGGAPLPAPVGLAADAPQLAFGANIVLEPGVSSYLPRPGAALRIDGLTTSYGASAATGDVREVQDEALGQHYEISAVVPSASAEQLAAATLQVPSGLEEMTAVPEGAAADHIRAVLEGIVDPSLSPYAQAQQVQAYLTSAAFTYSEVAPVNAGYDGSNIDVTAEFLDARSGYCVHFSSAMAIMGRMLGIPTRIQVGFTPGTPFSVNEQGQAVYQVTSNELHSWAELYVPNLGWVPFESTPSSGLGNLAAPNIDAPDVGIQQPGETPEATEGAQGEEGGTEATPTPPPPSEAADVPSDPAQSDEASGPSWPAWLNGTTLLVIGLVLAGLAVLALPALARILQRRRRRASIAQGSDGGGPGLAWRELLDEAIDHRMAVPEGAVVRRQEARLAEIASPPEPDPAVPAAETASADGGTPSAAEVTAALQRLRIAFERAAFDRPGTSVSAEWSDVELVERGIRAAATPRGRARAILLPASLPSLRQAIRARIAAHRGEAPAQSGEPGWDGREGEQGTGATSSAASAPASARVWSPHDTGTGEISRIGFGRGPGDEA